MRAAYKASAAGQVQQVEEGEKRKAEAKRSQAIGEGSKAALSAVPVSEDGPKVPSAWKGVRRPSY
jgi:hypothetical protein